MHDKYSHNQNHDSTADALDSWAQYQTLASKTQNMYAPIEPETGGSGRHTGCHSGGRPQDRPPEWRAGEQPEGRGPRFAGPTHSGLVISHISAHKPRREITLDVGNRDIRIHRSYGLTGKTKLGGGLRSSVTQFTNASKRRLMFTARNFPGLEIMLTLTYPSEFPLNGRTVKDHWKRFRQWMVRNGANTGLWVLEFQKRGAPHFHIFIRHALDRNEVSSAWYRIVGSKDPKHLVAGTRIETFRHPPALGSYVMKYASKMEQKDVPPEFENVGRFWGVWGKPDISKQIHLPQSVGKHLVRTIRRAHIKVRRSWTSHNRFRDNGRSGFVAWETSLMVRRMLDEFMENGVLHPT